jgi:hypothetical protein
MFRHVHKLSGNGGGRQTLEEERTRDCDRFTQDREGDIFTLTDRDWKYKAGGQR